MEKKKVVIRIIFVALIIVVAIHARYMEKEIETYNSQESASQGGF